jgi:hypothetical protein
MTSLAAVNILPGSLKHSYKKGTQKDLMKFPVNYIPIEKEADPGVVRGEKEFSI